jgi:hypothetical protein
MMRYTSAAKNAQSRQKRAAIGSRLIHARRHEMVKLGR